MTQPDNASNVNAIMVQSLIENAKRLGLVWDLRPATVNQGVNASRVLAVYDGDIQLMPMTSFFGPIVPGQRVYVISIPPAGHYIVGFIGPRMHFGVEMRQTPGQTFGHNSETIVEWTTVVTNNGFNISPPVTTFTIPATGVWSINATVRWPSNSSGFRRLNVYRNSLLVGDIAYPTINGSVVPQTIAKTIWCNIGDTINVRALQFTSGGTNLTLATTSETPNIMLWHVG